MVNYSTAVLASFTRRTSSTILISPVKIKVSRVNAGLSFGELKPKSGA